MTKITMKSGREKCQTLYLAFLLLMSVKLVHSDSREEYFYSGMWLDCNCFFPVKLIILPETFLSIQNPSVARKHFMTLSLSPTENRRLRLRNDGLIEMYHTAHKDWGGVCGSKVTDEVARVMCSELGLGQTGILKPYTSPSLLVQV